jgi:dTMP kinase
MFITFEGIEGSGKSLQISLAQNYLADKHTPSLATREPGGTEFGLAVRRVLLEKDGAPREALSELLLYLADRYQNLKQVIEPALRNGIVVLSDRYHDATRAYQGVARGVNPDTIDALARLLKIPEPDGTILLDLDPEIGLERARRRNDASPAAGAEGRFEAEGIAFHKNVREAYLMLARRFPERIRVVDASGTPDEVFARIIPILDEWIRCTPDIART